MPVLLDQAVKAISGGTLTRRDVRKLLSSLIRSDEELEAFCLDYFPDVKRHFSRGMDRLSKTNMLLEYETPAKLHVCLQEYARGRDLDSVRAANHEDNKQIISTPSIQDRGKYNAFFVITVVFVGLGISIICIYLISAFGTRVIHDQPLTSGHDLKDLGSKNLDLFKTEVADLLDTKNSPNQVRSRKHSEIPSKGGSKLPANKKDMNDNKMVDIDAIDEKSATGDKYSTDATNRIVDD